MLMTIVLTSTVVAQDKPPVRVKMQTIHGEIELELYPDKAPESVTNFLRYVDSGHYDGSSFYRTVRYDNDNGTPKIEVIQGGRGEAKPPFTAISHETTEQTGILHADGVISMARGKPGTASSEFFICIGSQPGLDFGESRNSDMQGFAAFGKVVGGMDVVRSIHQLPSAAASDSVYVEGQIIEDPAIITSMQRL
jgi:peptidyl-prolyl cis-trans isomerase A (cyclophilin A)